MKEKLKTTQERKNKIHLESKQEIRKQRKKERKN
jgi:hypothetical protein